MNTKKLNTMLGTLNNSGMLFGQRINGKSEQQKKINLEVYAEQLREKIFETNPVIAGWKLNDNFGCIELTNEKYPTVQINATPLFEGYERLPYNIWVNYEMKECDSMSFRTSNDLEDDIEKYVMFMENFVRKIDVWNEKGML